MATRKDDLDYLCDDILSAIYDNDIDLNDSQRPEHDMRIVLKSVLPKHLSLPERFIENDN